MKFGSVCSGIEAASTAWHPIGWETAYVAEIEPFPAAVLAARFGAGRPVHMPDPDAVEFPEGFDRDNKALAARLRLPAEWNKATFEEQCFLRAFDLRASQASAIKALDGVRWGHAIPNYGDFTRIADERDCPNIDLLIGGTPCQAFSFAGLRLSLADARGNLTLEFVRLVHASKSLRWAVWENVPGVLSTADNAFGCFLGGLVGSDAPVCVPGGGQMARRRYGCRATRPGGVEGSRRSTFRSRPTTPSRVRCLLSCNLRRRSIRGSF